MSNLYHKQELHYWQEINPLQFENGKYVVFLMCNELLFVDLQVVRIFQNRIELC